MSDTIACNLENLGPEELERHRDVAARWMACVQMRRRVDDGYAFTLPADPDTAASVAEFAMRERICCPFFTFTWSIEPGADTMTFLMTGPPGTAEFLEQSELVAN